MKYSRGIPENQFFVVYMEIFNLSARDLQVMPVRSISSMRKLSSQFPHTILFMVHLLRNCRNVCTAADASKLHHHGTSGISGCKTYFQISIHKETAGSVENSVFVPGMKSCPFFLHTALASGYTKAHIFHYKAPLSPVPLRCFPAASPAIC